MPDLFSTELLEVLWRGRGFPVVNFRTRISHDQAVHKRPDQDGARVEATGRNPIVFSCTAPMRNGISRGKNESWGVLYPTGHRQLIKDMSDRRSGELQHPSLGIIVCKPVSCESDLTATRRDGEDVQLEWIEDSQSEDASNAIFASESAIGSGVLEAIDLDTQLSQTNFGGFDPDAGKVSFEQAMRAVAGAVDTASLLSRRSFGMIDRVVYRLDAIDFAIRESRDPQNWPLKQTSARLRASLFRVKQAALAGPRDARFFITPAPTTIAALAPRLKNTVSDLVRLNPHLVATPQIASRTPVRYFAAA